LRALWKIDLNVKKAPSLNIVKKPFWLGFQTYSFVLRISDGLFSRIERLRKKENIQRFILFYNINALITISNIEDCWNQKLVSYDESVHKLRTHYQHVYCHADPTPFQSEAWFHLGLFYVAKCCFTSSFL